MAPLTPFPRFISYRFYPSPTPPPLVPVARQELETPAKMSTRQKDFPNCPDGDVLIVLNPMMSYKLHSQILSRASTFFAEQLKSDPAPLSAKARRDGATGYRFELTKSMTFDDPFGHLEPRISESGNGKPMRSSFGQVGLNELTANPERLRHWDLLFRAFYGIQCQFKQDNMAVLLSDCAGLLDVAESIGSIDRIREIVDLSLLRQDNVLWESIRGNPIAWIVLATRLQSPSIFTEAAIHLVGNWRRIDADAKASLPTEIRIVIEEKNADLDMAKNAIEMRILGHYPKQLIRKAADKPGRPSYANDIYMWMCICFFRHYFAQAISDERTRCAPDGGHAFYQVLFKAGPAYLHHEDFFAFHQYFPMSSKGCNVVERDMAILKLDIREYVDQLVINRTHVPSESVDYLTCAVIRKRDLPWEVSQSTDEAAGANNRSRPANDITSSSSSSSDDDDDDPPATGPCKNGGTAKATVRNNSNPNTPVILNDSDAGEADAENSIMSTTTSRPKVYQLANGKVTGDSKVKRSQGIRSIRPKTLAPVKVAAPTAATADADTGISTKPPGPPAAKGQRKSRRAQTVVPTAGDDVMQIDDDDDDDE